MGPNQYNISVSLCIIIMFFSQVSRPNKIIPNPGTAQLNHVPNKLSKLKLITKEVFLEVLNLSIQYIIYLDSNQACRLHPLL